MARPLRIELSGGVYHVTSRGDGRDDIYLSDADREAWLEVFGQVCERFNWICHAWCQMTNHYHILIETPEANLVKGMRQLNGVYTKNSQRIPVSGLALTHFLCLQSRGPFSHSNIISATNRNLFRGQLRNILIILNILHFNTSSD